MFRNKKALVVGGSGGIGREISILLAEKGADVTVHGSRKSEKFDSLLEVLKNKASESGGKVSSIIYNFYENDFENISNSPLIKSSETADILCVCFGPFLQKAIDEMTVQDWQLVSLMDYALPGVFVSSALKGMKQKKWGRIILFGGTGTSVRSEFKTNAAYAGAKSGISVLVESTAFSYADYGITCNGILPGFTQTEYTQNKEILEKKMPLATMISAESVAKSALCLMENPDINGALLRVDRGWSPLASL